MLIHCRENLFVCDHYLVTGLHATILFICFLYANKKPLSSRNRGPWNPSCIRELAAIFWLRDNAVNIEKLVSRTVHMYSYNSATKLQ
jgi:hypothetical protein